MSDQNLQSIQERLYIIRWTFEGVKEGKTNLEPRVETYQWKDRQKAINRYLDLKEKYYALDLKFQIAQPQDINIDSLLNNF